MKKGFLRSLLIYLAGIPFLHGQERTVNIEKQWLERDFYPQISGYFDGKIPIDKFCASEGLKTNVGYKILTYDLQYEGHVRDQSIHVVGDQIPDSVCIMLYRMPSGSEVYFSNIKSMDRDGRIIHLSPMRLVIVGNKEE